jgi:hypothetical protein
MMTNKHSGVENIFLLNEDELLYGLCVKKNPSVLHQPAYLLGYAYVPNAFTRGTNVKKMFKCRSVKYLNVIMLNT